MDHGDNVCWFSAPGLIIDIDVNDIDEQMRQELEIRKIETIKINMSFKIN